MAGITAATCAVFGSMILRTPFLLLMHATHAGSQLSVHLKPAVILDPTADAVHPVPKNLAANSLSGYAVLDLLVSSRVDAFFYSSLQSARPQTPLS
jgi:hypothetical protein